MVSALSQTPDVCLLLTCGHPLSLASWGSLTLGCGRANSGCLSCRCFLILVPESSQVYIIGSESRMHLFFEVTYSLKEPCIDRIFSIPRKGIAHYLVSRWGLMWTVVRTPSLFPPWLLGLSFGVVSSFRFSYGGGRGAVWLATFLLITHLFSPHLSVVLPRTLRNSDTCFILFLE